MINFIISYYIFLTYRNKLDRNILLMLTESLLVYSDENRVISFFIFVIYLMNYIDIRHCNGKPEIDAVREFGILSSFLVRISFFFYTIYYHEHIRNILYSIYLMISTQLDWEECNNRKKSKRIYDIVDYSSRIIFLLSCFISKNSISINLDIITNPFILFFSGISILV